MWTRAVCCCGKYRPSLSVCSSGWGFLYCATRERKGQVFSHRDCFINLQCPSCFFLTSGYLWKIILISNIYIETVALREVQGVFKSMNMILCVCVCVFSLSCENVRWKLHSYGRRVYLCFILKLCIPTYCKNSFSFLFYRSPPFISYFGLELQIQFPSWQWRWKMNTFLRKNLRPLYNHLVPASLFYTSWGPKR